MVDTETTVAVPHFFLILRDCAAIVSKDALTDNITFMNTQLKDLNHDKKTTFNSDPAGAARYPDRALHPGR